jgi:hypothetical protein
MADEISSTIDSLLSKQQAAFDERDRAERLALGKKMKVGGIAVCSDDPSVIYTLDELKALVPLERDRLRYIKLALNRFGLLSAGKQRGRMTPRMNQHQQGIKSASLSIFRTMFERSVAQMKSTCTAEGIEYIGMPESTIEAIGKKATLKAITLCKKNRRALKRAANRRQAFSRKVNYGLSPKPRNESAYVNKGAQYGR